MPVKRPQMVNGEIYHIVTRAIEGLELFRNERDYLRMLYSLFIFNNQGAAPSTYRGRLQRPLSERVLARIMNDEKRKLLVQILSFCLMPNHIHLLIQQVTDGGISKFMRKIGAGYGGYYNKKYERSGHVFQGRYRIVHVKDQEQLKNAFVYIHVNPVSIIFPDWKKKGIKDIEAAIEFLENYKWSSYSDYLGKENFPRLTDRNFLTEIIGGVEGCKEFVDSWLRFFKKDFDGFKEIALE